MSEVAVNFGHCPARRKEDGAEALILFSKMTITMDSMFEAAKTMVAPEKKAETMVAVEVDGT